MHTRVQHSCLCTHAHTSPSLHREWKTPREGQGTVAERLTSSLTVGVTQTTGGTSHGQDSTPPLLAKKEVGKAVRLAKATNPCPSPPPGLGTCSTVQRERPWSPERSPCLLSAQEREEGAAAVQQGSLGPPGNVPEGQVREGPGAELGAQRSHAGRRVPSSESLLAEAGERRGLRSLVSERKAHLPDTRFPPERGAAQPSFLLALLSIRLNTVPWDKNRLLSKSLFKRNTQCK